MLTNIGNILNLLMLQSITLVSRRACNNIQLPISNDKTRIMSLDDVFENPENRRTLTYGMRDFCKSSNKKFTSLQYTEEEMKQINDFTAREYEQSKTNPRANDLVPYIPYIPPKRIYKATIDTTYTYTDDEDMPCQFCRKN